MVGINFYERGNYNFTTIHLSFEKESLLVVEFRKMLDVRCIKWIARKSIHFIEGYGSLLSIFPARKSDEENIISDWLRVGNYFWHATGKANGKPSRRR